MLGGERVHYMKSESRLCRAGLMDKPKGIVSPGEGLVKMVRVLLVRPAGGSGSSGCKRSCGTGGRAAEEKSPI